VRPFDASHVTWRKSSRSKGASDQTNCVEVAGLAGRVAMRDSKNPTGAALALPRAQWRAFLASIRAGELD
jgi:hypothetical protein